MDPHLEFITGIAGTGKTTLLRNRIDESKHQRSIGKVKRSYGTLCATTGIAAINLSSADNIVTTINSELKFFDTESLEDNAAGGKLSKALQGVATKGRNLVVDEISMMEDKQLDLIYKSLVEVNNLDNIQSRGGLGLVLCGDFCLGLGTKVTMADGSLKTIESIKVDEQVMGIDSTPRNVLRTTKGLDTLYIVHQSNGDSYIVNSNHRVVLKRGVNGSRMERGYLKYPNYPDDIHISAKTLYHKSKKFRECFVGYKVGCISLCPKLVNLDPYFLGLWLGDGDSDAPRITTMDEEVKDFCYWYASQHKLHITTTTYDRTKAVRLSFAGNKRGTGSKDTNFISRGLGSYDLWKNKHIPTEYLLNSEDIRLRLLAGIIDSDGCWHGARYTITLTNEILAKDVKQLANQLGFRVGFREVTNGTYAAGGAWTVSIGGDTWRIPCRVKRKISIKRDLVRSRLTSVVSIQKQEIGEYAGIEIDGDNLFLLGDGTVLHNCQLPPINGQPIYKAKCWEKFAEHTTKLTKVYRQDNQQFLEGLNMARAGDGGKAAEIFSSIKSITWIGTVNSRFAGTTIVSTNKEVDRINQVRLDRLMHNEHKQEIRIRNFRWGKQQPEWKQVPDELVLAEGAYVMILSNDTPDFEYVNGDCGMVEEVRQGLRIVYVNLVRNHATIGIGRIIRRCLSRDLPPGEVEPIYMKKKEWKEQSQPGYAEYKSNLMDAGYRQYLEGMTIENKPKEPYKVYFDYVQGKWVLGELDYVPIRLAYASTVHKCVSPESYVMSQTRGIIKIKEVKEGEFIYTGKSGEYRKVLAIGASNKETWKLRTISGLDIVCSGEHRVKTPKGYKKVEGLVDGDLVRVTDIKMAQSTNSLIPNEVAYLLGLLVGDGCITDSKEGNIHFCCQDEYLQSRFSEILETHYSIQSSNRSDGKGSFATSLGVRRMLAILGLTYAKAASKEIPKSVMNTSNLPSFLRGLYDTDGHVGTSGIVLTTSSNTIAKQVSLALWLLGIPNKRKQYPGVNDSFYWQIRINANGIEQFRDIIGFERPNKAEALNFLMPNRIIRKFDGWDEVVSVYNTNVVIPMLDLEVEDIHSFWVDGIVTHNSQGLSLENVQIDYSNAFFGNPSMSYVALSRCRTPEGLTIVGSPKLLAARTNVLEEVLPWI